MLQKSNLDKIFSLWQLTTQKNQFKNMKTRLQFTLTSAAFFLAISLIFPSIASAQEASDSLKLYNIEELVVTGSRATMDKQKVPQKIEVISAQDIEMTPYQDFTDII